MFPNRSACYMDLMPCHDDSQRESLKQTMLNQENMFRKQVQELHRLYQIQTVLTKNLRLKEVPSMQSLNYSKQDCRVNWSNYYHRPLGFEVPVSSYVSNFDKPFSNKGDGWGTRKNPVEIEDDFHGETESSVEETKLSLSIGRDSSPRMNGWRTQNEKPHFAVSQDVIEFEESIRMPLSRDVEFKSALRCVPCSAHSGEKSSTEEYLSNRGNKSQSLRDERINIPEPKFINQGDKKEIQKLPSAVVCKLFSSHGAACLDLNSPQPDESSLDLKDPKMDYSYVHASSGVVIGELYKGTSSDAVSWTKLNDNCSTMVPTPNASGSKPYSINLESYPESPSDSSEEDHGCLGKAADSTRDFPSRKCNAETVTEVNGEKGDDVLVNSYLCSSGETVEDVIGERSPALSKSDHVAQDPSSSLKTMQSGTNLERSFSRQNSNSSQVDSADIIGSKPDFPSRNCKDESVLEVNGEKGDDVLVHSYLCSSGETVEDVVIDESSPALSKSDPIAQDPSSSLKTMQSGTYIERSFSRMNSFQISDSSQVESGAAIFESKSRSSGDENGESAHDDPMIQRGAVSLAYFCLEARREHEVKKTKINEPERSMDSFEANILKLQESNTDYFCVSSSNPYEINDMDKKDCGIKLRRGRRMKDFQKEILPSLPSLTRQEICEDIRIMEGAMRSREYKRSQSKITAEHKWCTPVRSRRSRLQYTGRRCYK